MHKQQQTWLSAYIYYKGPLDEVLKYLIKPFIEKVSGKYMTQYFFIRYYEDGPHIRLRLKGESLILKEYVKPYLTERAKCFFSNASSESESNTIQFNDYQPEASRYGGAIGIRISERLFQISSEITLDVVSSQSWNFNKAMGAALQLHTILLFYFFDDLKEIKNFLAFGHQNWIHLSIGVEQEGEVNMDSMRLLLREQEKAYEKQSNSINETIGNVWNTLENNSFFGDNKMDHWQMEIKEIAEEFRFHLREIISCSALEISRTVTLENYSLGKWAIIDSYIHMTHNRLGLLYKEESFLYYILRTFFSSSNFYAIKSEYEKGAVLPNK